MWRRGGGARPVLGSTDRVEIDDGAGCCCVMLNYLAFDMVSCSDDGTTVNASPCELFIHATGD